ncbi:YiaA/YiaB family inner membrane protein [uncultured Jatrophihabitans sp.]|uniref:YiaA/YiaB family inner membrane protein n=1 Tax=uncultured Jatrophihabitans sp. TaxID=1610747 RepID=UPI0035CA94F6
MTNSPAGSPRPSTTSAFYLQSIIAFSIALGVVIIGEVYLPVSPWIRAFLALGTVFLVSSTFSLAKCVRDQQETETVVSRIDRARIERMLAEYDPYRVPAPPAGADQQNAPYPAYPNHNPVSA